MAGCPILSREAGRWFFSFERKGGFDERDQGLSCPPLLFRRLLPPLAKTAKDGARPGVDGKVADR
jgi:hypothetical protein